MSLKKLKMSQGARFYVARRACCGCIAAVIADDTILPDVDKAEMVRGCIEAGLTVDRLTLDQITGILLAQRDCKHPSLNDDMPFDEDSDGDDDDDDMPF